MLVAGLVAGTALPDLARAMRPAIAPVIVLLLFLAVLRLGPEGLRVGIRDMRRATRLALALQLALPLAAALLFGALGCLGHPLAMGVVLALGAAPITGSPNITLMTGGDPAPALRQLVIGTALLPLTVLPVFWMIPAFGSPVGVALASFQLLVLIALAGGLALVLRYWRLVPGTERSHTAIDGLASLALAAVVIGLMSAIAPAMRGDPVALLTTLVVVFALNIPLQIVASLFARRADPRSATALGIAAGNRNVALFLSVLPPQAADQLLLFIGCFQIPMYLTPLIMARWYRKMQAPP